jgi:hypothetical protein
MAGFAPIGGFIGLEAAGGGGGAKAGFGQGERLCFWNARAAMAHLFAALDVRRVWLPAYICRAAADAAAQGGREVRFYAVGGELRPDAEALARELRAGDAVVGVDYFGAPAAGLAELAGRFPDLTWVQDRAQSLWPDPQPWGAHLVYSPRKVAGVPDGGVLVSRSGALPPPAWAADDDRNRIDPVRMRAEDPEGNAAWFPAYQAAEAAMSCEPRPMSEVSRQVAAGFDAAAAAARRRANAAALLARIGEAALFDADRLLAGAPLGVPVLTPDAADASRRMAGARIFCARHWADLPSPAADFPAEHELSRRLITLPCDHRYGEAEMARVADVFLGAA